MGPEGWEACAGCVSHRFVSGATAETVLEYFKECREEQACNNCEDEFAEMISCAFAEDESVPPASIASGQGSECTTLSDDAQQCMGDEGWAACSECMSESMGEDGFVPTFESVTEILKSCRDIDTCTGCKDKVDEMISCAFPASGDAPAPRVSASIA